MTEQDRATLAALGLEATANRAMHLRGTQTGAEIDAALTVVLRLAAVVAAGQELQRRYDNDTDGSWSDYMDEFCTALYDYEANLGAALAALDAEDRV